MANIRVIENIRDQGGSIDTSTWRTVLVDNLGQKQKELYLHRKMAIDLYLSNTLTVAEWSVLDLLDTYKGCYNKPRKEVFQL